MERMLIDMDINDAVLERPYGFSIGGDRYYLYPSTLGTKLITSRIIKELRFNEDNLSSHPYAEALRVINIRKDDVLRVIAHHMINCKEQHFDEGIIGGYISMLHRELKDDDIAVLLCMVLSEDSIEAFKKHIGLTQEQPLRERVNSMKKSNNTITFGGKSIYGTLIDTACERYGWTLDYVVWGISYTNLCMMLADSVNHVYLTDEEAKRIHRSDTRDSLNADDPDVMKKVLTMSWE